MNILTYLLIGTLSFYSTESQQNIIQPISKVEWCICNNVAPKESDIVDFLKIVASLTNEVETTQYANELLFLLLNDYTDATILALGNLDSHSRKAVYSQLYRPIHDGIDISLISNKLKTSRFRKLKHNFISRKLQHILSLL